jgi:hypothetical protein
MLSVSIRQPKQNDNEKVPGAGEVYMVYDARDRLVLTQDANMRVKVNG